MRKRLREGHAVALEVRGSTKTSAAVKIGEPCVRDRTEHRDPIAESVSRDIAVELRGVRRIARAVARTM